MKNKLTVWSGGLCGVLLYFLAINIAQAEPLKFADIRSPYKYFFTATQGGGKEIYIKGTDSVERFSVQGNVFYREVTHWYYEKDQRHKYEDAVMVKQDDYCYPLYLLRIVTNGEGKVIREEEIIFNREKHTAQVMRSYNDPAKEDDWGLDTQINKEFTELPDDTYVKPMLNMCLRSLPMTKGLKFNIHMITRLGMLFRVFYEVTELEKVTTSTREFVCYRIKQEPEANLGKFLPVPHQLTPAQIFWYTAEEPHRLIKYQGYEEEPAVRSQLGPILSGGLEIVVDKIEPLGIDNLEDKTVLLERMRRHKLIPDTASQPQ